MDERHLYPVVRELWPDFWVATVLDGKYAGWGTTALEALRELRQRMRSVVLEKEEARDLRRAA